MKYKYKITYCERNLQQMGDGWFLIFRKRKGLIYALSGWDYLTLESTEETARERIRRDNEKESFIPIERFIGIVEE